VSENSSYSAPISWEEEEVEPVEEDEAKPIDLQAVTDSANEMLGKATDIASNAMKKASGAFEQAKTAVGEAAARTSIGQSPDKSVPDTSTPASAVIENKHSDMQKYMSKDDLWTWLKKEDRRKLFYLEDREAPTQEEYMQLLVNKIDSNGVPASIVHKPVMWDRSEVKSDEYLVHPYTEAVNPLTCCLKFVQVGKFCFVEQKTFLAPPKLPSRPGEKRRVPDVSKQKRAMFYGAIAMIVGFIILMSSCSMQSSSYTRSVGGTFSMTGLICLIAGAVMFFWGYSTGNIKEILEHNKKVDEEIRLWNQAWDNWENSVFVHSFQEASNGQVTRVYQAVFDCMRQVNDELFSDVVASEEKDDNSMSDLRAQIAHRKDTYR
jgi:hypothetical protein